MAPAESVDFYCVQFFLIILMGVTTSKLFTCWSGTQSLSVLLFFSFLSKHMLNKKDAQLESCRLSFILWQNEDWSQGDSKQIALRDCSQEVVVRSLSHVRLCDPMDCSLPGFSVHGVFQARVLLWGAIAFSRGSSWPRDRTQVSCIAGRCFTLWAVRYWGEGQYIRFWWRGSSVQSSTYFIWGFSPRIWCHHEWI